MYGATINTFESNEQVTFPEQTCIVIDMDIIEYFYACEMNDILNDDKLMDLIVTNPYYKEAICDAFDINEMTITHKGVKYIFNGPPKSIRSTLEMLDPTVTLEPNVIPVGVKYKNLKEDNIGG